MLKQCALKAQLRFKEYKNWNDWHKTYAKLKLIRRHVELHKPIWHAAVICYVLTAVSCCVFLLFDLPATGSSTAFCSEIYV